jgi:hypothetical protein
VYFSSRATVTASELAIPTCSMSVHPGCHAQVTVHLLLCNNVTLRQLDKPRPHDFPERRLNKCWTSKLSWLNWRTCLRWRESAQKRSSVQFPCCGNHQTASGLGPSLSNGVFAPSRCNLASVRIARSVERYKAAIGDACSLACKATLPDGTLVGWCSWTDRSGKQCEIWSEPTVTAEGNMHFLRQASKAAFESSNRLMAGRPYYGKSCQHCSLLLIRRRAFCHLRRSAIPATRHSDHAHQDGDGQGRCMRSSLRPSSHCGGHASLPKAGLESRRTQQNHGP